MAMFDVQMTGRRSRITVVIRMKSTATRARKRLAAQR
jgi:hypothetical protein